MKLNRKNAGFTLIELMIVVAIIAIIASIAIPKLMSARISANENAAVATLRSIASAQAQLQSSSAIDTDADGGGEFGFFGELAGTAPLRVFNPGAPAVPILDPGAQQLDPPILPTAFGNVIPDLGGEMVVERQGYIFKMFLPGLLAGGNIPGIAETGPVLGGGVAGGATNGNMPDSDNCEVMWACYAWPSTAESTGNRAFFINQEGDLLQTLNVQGAANSPTFYDGIQVASPVFNAAFDNGALGGNLTGMGAPLGITAMGGAAVDNNVWTVVGN